MSSAAVPTPTREERARVEEQALLEYFDWYLLLELERIGPTRTNRDQAIRELQRERFTTPAHTNQYKPKTRTAA